MAETGKSEGSVFEFLQLPIPQAMGGPSLHFFSVCDEGPLSQLQLHV